MTAMQYKSLAFTEDLLRIRFMLHCNMGCEEVRADIGKFTGSFKLTFLE